MRPTKLFRGYGISELVASLMTLLITVSLGSLILYLINEYVSNTLISFRSRFEELRIAGLRSLDIIVAIGNESTHEIAVVVASGKLEIRVLAIYVDEVLVRDSQYVIRPYEIAVLRVKSPVALQYGKPFTVKIVYDGGEGVIYGFTYR